MPSSIDLGNGLLEHVAPPNCTITACDWLPPNIVIHNAHPMPVKYRTGFQASQGVTNWKIYFSGLWRTSDNTGSIRMNLCKEHTDKLLKYFPPEMRDASEEMSELFLEDRTFLW